MCMYFKTETDVAQNLIDDFLSSFDFDFFAWISEKAEV